MATLTDVLAGSQAQATQLQQVIDALKGTVNKGVPIALVSLNDPNNYALTVQNDDPSNSRGLSVLKADGTTLISADVNGVTLAGPLNVPLGSISTSAIAANAVQQLLGQYNGVPSFSTSTVGVWIATPVSVPITTGGGLLRLEVTVNCYNTVANQLIMATYAVDGVVGNTFALANSPGVNYLFSMSFTQYLAGVVAGAHTIAVYLQNYNGGTLSLSNSAVSALFVTEQKR